MGEMARVIILIGAVLIVIGLIMLVLPRLPFAASFPEIS